MPIPFVRSVSATQRTTGKSTKRPFLHASAISAIATLLSPFIAFGSAPIALANTRCPAALDRFQTHTVAAGETVASVAAAYRLQAETLVRFNPGISGTLPTGSTLQVPPFNGQVVQPNAGDTWQTLAERYETRADLLFEVNGCVTQLPREVFIPGANQQAVAASPRTAVELPGYPLDEPARILRGYGWQPNTAQDALIFNSGIAFAIPTAQSVLAVDSGTVAFAGEREGYGKLVVINHAQGLQTRYANLSDLSVSVGQSVTATTAVGEVGGNTPTYLYFEVRANSASGWIAQDPGKYLPALELR